MERNIFEKQRELNDRLNRYRDEYYNRNAPSVSDEVYDRLFDELKELEQETGIQMANSPTQTVGYPAVSRLEKTRHEIPLLSLDKTTGALDSHSSQMLLSTIQSINEDLGATILMVTHDAFSASYANRILFMRDGAIFTEIRKGGDSRRTFFEKILDVLTMMGGGMSDVR